MCAKKASDEPQALSLEEVVEDAQLRMMSAVEALDDRLRSVRTGRASAALVEHLRVKAYGTETPLRQLAGVAVPEPRMIMLRPYDPSVIGDIEKAIISAELGLNPQNDGKVIRIPIPPLTEERRRELVRIVEREAEATRVAIRNVRRDANKSIDAIKKSGDAPEDDCFKARDEIQTQTTDSEKEVDAKAKSKTDEIMEV